MAWFTRKNDPIQDRARVLKSEIAALEAQINRLDSQLTRKPAAPSLHRAEAQSRTSDPIFEEVDLGRLENAMDAPSRPEHFNELGVRKYDLPALLARIKNHLKGPSATNPKLVSYLAAGGIQGLRPMRYEKRVARNRFVALVAVLFLVMLWILALFVRQG